MLSKHIRQLRRPASRCHSSNMQTADESTSVTCVKSITRFSRSNRAMPRATTATTLFMVTDPSTLSLPPSDRTTSAVTGLLGCISLFIASYQRTIFVRQCFKQFLHPTLVNLTIESAAVIGYQAYTRYRHIVNFPPVIGFFHAVIDRYRLLTLTLYHLSCLLYTSDAADE